MIPNKKCFKVVATKSFYYDIWLPRWSVTT